MRMNYCRKPVPKKRPPMAGTTGETESHTLQPGQIREINMLWGVGLVFQDKRRPEINNGAVEQEIDKRRYISR